MDDNVIKIIKERFDALPESIKEAILSSDYENSLIDISKQYQLNVEQMGILERETTLVMMGLTPTNNFETELIRELNIEKAKGSQIVNDINEKIFLKIRELLKLMNTPKGEEPQIEEIKKAENDDAQVLSSHGIEIIPEKLELTGAEKAEELHPMLRQKLSTSIQTPVAKTEHTLQNLSSNNTPHIPIKPGVDPYREVPE